MLHHGEAILLTQIFTSFRPHCGQNSVARSHFILLIHQIFSFCPQKGLGRTKICINKMVYWVITHGLYHTITKVYMDVIGPKNQPFSSLSFFSVLQLTEYVHFVFASVFSY